MSPTIIITIISLSLLALISAVILYFVAQKFKIFEDPRIDEIQAILPAANCGGCGFAGCRNFAEALVKAGSFDGLYCPVGGGTVMGLTAKMLGKEAPVVDPQIAVLLCNGTPENRPRTSTYDGASTAIGFGLALVILAGIREQLELVDIPKGMRGVSISLVIAGILAMAFMGFTGIVK